MVEPGFPLGIEESVSFPTMTFDPGPGPFGLFCYTDGVIEAMDNDRRQFGTDRLLHALVELHTLDPTPLVKGVRKQVAAFAAAAKQSDDITILAARIE